MASNDINAIILEVANKYGLDPDYLRAMGGIESRHNQYAHNRGSGARGLFQFLPKTWQRYGRGQDVNDPRANTDAAARFTLDNIKHFKSAMGRDPTHGEMYLMHQQGPGGAVSILQNPQGRAADTVGLRAVRGNLPAHVRRHAGSMTNEDFSRNWMRKADERVTRYRNDIPRDIASAPLAPPEGATASNKPLSTTPTLKELSPEQRTPPYDVASTMKMIFPDTANTPKPAAAQGLQQQTAPAQTLGPMRTAAMAPQVKTPKPFKGKIEPETDIADSLVADIRAGKDVRAKFSEIEGVPIPKDVYDGFVELVKTASPTAAAAAFRDAFKLSKASGYKRPTPAQSPSEKIAADSIAKSDGSSVMVDGKPVPVKTSKTRPSTPEETAVPGGDPGSRFDTGGTPRTFGDSGRSYNDYVNEELSRMNSRGRNLPATAGDAPPPAAGGGGGRSVVPASPSGGAVGPRGGGAVGSGGQVINNVKGGRGFRPQDPAVAGGVITAGAMLSGGPEGPAIVGDRDDPVGRSVQPRDTADAAPEVEPGAPGSMRGTGVGGPSIDDTGGLGSPGSPQAPNTATPRGGVYPGYTTDPEEAARRRSVNRAGKGDRAVDPRSQGDQLMDQMVEQALGIPPGSLRTPQGMKAASDAIEVVKQRVAQDPGLTKAAVSNAARKDAEAAQVRRAAPPPPPPMPRQRQATDYGGSPTSASDRMTDLAAQNPGMAQLYQFFAGGQGGQ